MLDKLKNEVFMTYEQYLERQEQNNLKDVPYRVKLLILGGLVNWKEVLPYWFEEFKKRGVK